MCTWLHKIANCNCNKMSWAFPKWYTFKVLKIGLGHSQREPPTDLIINVSTLFFIRVYTFLYVFYTCLDFVDFRFFETYKTSNTNDISKLSKFSKFHLLLSIKCRFRAFRGLRSPDTLHLGGLRPSNALHPWGLRLQTSALGGCAPKP